MVGQESISICHGNKTKNKQKHLPRKDTELHGKDRSRDTEEQAEELATETKHCFQSRMRERRYKYAVRKGPLRQAQGPGFRYGMVSELASGEPAEPVELAVINCARVKDTASHSPRKRGIKQYK